MKSIQTKFIVLILSALIINAVLIGGYAVYHINSVVNQDTETMMNAICTEQGLKIDMQLQKIEQSVTAIYNYANTEVDFSSMISDEEYRIEYINEVEKLSVDIAEHTDGVRAVYFRIDPNLTKPEEGFFYVQEQDESKFVKNKVTRILDYDRNDTEHVGWFYQPKDAGHPIWMSPYYNRNIDILIISYIIPFYYDEQFVGVIGMDMDFRMLVELADSAALYEGGHANLVDMDLKKIYYEEEESGEILESDITENLYNNLSSKDYSDKTLEEYNTEHDKYVMADCSVDNGMNYILYAPSKVIHKRRNNLITAIVIITFDVVLIFWAFTTYMTSQIIRPLKALTAASKRIAEGEWSVDIECNTKDEVCTLTKSINKMAHKLKEHVSEINHMAYRDSLTGVKNKNYYNDYIKMLDSDYRVNGKPYAVVVFDVNNLKEINDEYGHIAGDILLTEACSYICHTFTHSPVFRIGGDEFVVILEGEDYFNRNALLKDFENNMENNKLSVEPYCSVSIAYGMYENQELAENFDSIFKSADEKMYEKKRQMKEANQ